MNEEYAEYRCSACRKAILKQDANHVLSFFYHPGCVNRHKIYDKNQEVVTCPGPFEKFMIDGDKEGDLKRIPTSAGNSRNRLGSTGSVGSIASASGASKSLTGGGTMNMDG